MLTRCVWLVAGPIDYHVIRRVQLQRFDGRQWVRFGEVIGN
ncbi:MAG TPA: hypothetical protein VEK05_05705 [Burkholderiales bacterium]|nr:hypothetical protein [Burkholderiales bacterium]